MKPFELFSLESTRLFVQTCWLYKPCSSWDSVETDGVNSGELREALQVISVLIAASLRVCVCQAAQIGLCNWSDVSLAVNRVEGVCGGGDVRTLLWSMAALLC